MDSNTAVEQLYEKILAEYKPFFEQLNAEKLEEYTQSNIDLIINEFSKKENSFKMIFDNVNYKILATSDNLEALTGYTQEELKNGNVLLYFKTLEFDNLLAPFYLGRWLNSMFKHIATLKNVNYESMQVAFCGIKMKRKNGEKARTLQRYIPLEISEAGHMNSCFATGEDIKHLLKSDFYWARIACGEHKFYYSSVDKKTCYQDIVSEREKDVLQLIAEGWESKEIGKKLFLSSNTIDNHRRNAIARTGARDTTALIQLCHMVGIL